MAFGSADVFAGDKGNQHNVAIDTIAGVKYERVKLVDGAEGNTTAIAAGGGVEAGALRVTIASDSTGVVSVDDNGGSLTVDGTVTVTGVATEATLDARTGALTETAPATDTASSGLNGRLQRIAQRLTSLIALIPTSLGQKTKANSFAVTLASDQDALPITDNAGSLTVDNAGTFAVQDSQTITDNAGFTDGTSKVFAAGFVFDEVAGTALTENDAAAARIDSKRAQVGVIEDATTRGQRAAVSAAGRLSVDASGVAVPITDNSGSLTVDNAGTFVVQENGAALTSLQLIDDIVYTDDTSTHATGTSKGALIMAGATPTDTAVDANDIGAVAMTLNRELLVQVNTALPAGTNGIGKLTANSGVDIGDVDVTSVTPGTGATNLGKLEDGPHTTGDVGVMALGVRNDAGTTLAGADGDYIPLSIDANGALRVTGGGGGTQYTEDAVAAADPVGNALIVVRNDARSGTLVSADGDNIALRGSNNGELYVSAAGGAAHDAAVAGNPLLLGAYADTDGDVTAVSADGDAVRLIADLKGRLVVRPVKFQTFIVVNSANLTTATTAYVAGDTLGLANAVPATFASAARVSGGTGIIRGIYVLDKADITGVVTVFVFRASVTLAADNAAWSVSDSDMESCILRQQISMTDEGNQRVGFWSGYTPFDCNASDLFVGMRTDNAHTFFGAASDIRTKLWIEQD